MEENRKNVKLIVMVVIIILAIVLAIGGILFWVFYDETTQKESEILTLSETKSVEGFEVSDFNVTYQNGLSTIKAKVKNTTEETLEGTSVNIKILDDNGISMIEILGYLDTLQPGEEGILDTSITMNLSGMKNLEITKAEEQQEIEEVVPNEE